MMRKIMRLIDKMRFIVNFEFLKWCTKIKCGGQNIAKNSFLLSKQFIKIL